MKVVRSGVQKLIKNECPNLLDVGCICHLADLTIKEGMKTLPVDIDQLFIDVFYYCPGLLDIVPKTQDSSKNFEYISISNSLFYSIPYFTI